MANMLVNLKKLPDSSELIGKLEKEGISVYRPLTANKSTVLRWVEKHFNERWSDEVSTAFSHQPVSLYIAWDENRKKILGFAAYDCTYRDYFGPTGVDEAERGRGIGKALLFRCMEALRDEGYVYGIIGAAGPVDFYHKCVGAIPIDEPRPAGYEHIIHEEDMK